MHNALFAPDGTVRSVLDWELTTTGDPLADLGQMMAYWTESGAAARGPTAVFREPFTELEGFVGAADLADEYASQSGEDVGDLNFWVAFAYWKTAIIVEGVYSRWRTDPTNGVGAGDLGAAVPRLANRALEVLSSGSFD
jgi:aminoglycoside phosphotransferase (APT) family kinase protein